ncbi:MAG: YicC family protein [Deltaproteobacteria bacterium]|nr:YicC family protein [Deltaproteobacteria bacterium]
MLLSMTGYGRSEYTADTFQLVVEIKAYNHRFCEVKARLPREFSLLEHRLIDYVQEECKRGSIEVSVVKVALAEEALSGFRANAELALQWYDALRKIADRLKFDKKSITFRDILACPNVIEPALPHEMDLEVSWSNILPAVDAALEELQEMRRVEGKKLSGDLFQRGERIGERLGLIKRMAPQVTKSAFEKMMKRAQELLAQSGQAGVTLAEERLAQEMAIYAERADITEEVVRAESHLAQWSEFMRQKGEEPLGRKLEFLLQEIHREVNTIGSKAGSSEISQHGVEMKSVLEQMREQVQNVL